MSYKLKSLLYLAVFVAAAFLYEFTSEEVPEKVVVKPVETEKGLTDNSQLEAAQEAAILEEAILK